MSIKIPTCYAPRQQEAPRNGVDKKHPQAQLSMAHKQTSCNTQNLTKLKNFADCVKKPMIHLNVFLYFYIYIGVA